MVVSTIKCLHIFNHYVLTDILEDLDLVCRFNRVDYKLEFV